jgi:hypothetical protein
MTSTTENTKDLSQFQLADLLESCSENLLEEILQLGLQQLMELERPIYTNNQPLAIRS